MQPKSEMVANRMETLRAFAFRMLFDSSGIRKGKTGQPSVYDIKTNGDYIYICCI